MAIFDRSRKTSAGSDDQLSAALSAERAFQKELGKIDAALYDKRPYDDVDGKILTARNPDPKVFWSELMGRDVREVVLEIVKSIYNSGEPGRIELETKYWMSTLEQRTAELVKYGEAKDPEFLARAVAQSYGKLSAKSNELRHAENLDTLNWELTGLWVRAEGGRCLVLTDEGGRRSVLKRHQFEGSEIVLVAEDVSLKLSKVTAILLPGVELGGVADSGFIGDRPPTVEHLAQSIGKRVVVGTDDFAKMTIVKNVLCFGDSTYLVLDQVGLVDLKSITSYRELDGDDPSFSEALYFRLRTRIGVEGTGTETMIQALLDQDSDVRQMAAFYLRERPGAATSHFLLQALQDPNLLVALNAFESLGRLQEEEIISRLPVLLSQFEPSNWEFFSDYIRSGLRGLKSENGARALIKAMCDYPQMIRRCSRELSAMKGLSRELVPDLTKLYDQCELYGYDSAAIDVSATLSSLGYDINSRSWRQ